VGIAVQPYQAWYFGAAVHNDEVELAMRAATANDRLTTPRLVEQVQVVGLETENETDFVWVIREWPSGRAERIESWLVRKMPTEP